MTARRPFTRRSLLKGSGAAAFGLGTMGVLRATSTPANALQEEVSNLGEGEDIKISISHIGGGSREGSEKSDRMKQLRAHFPHIEFENRWMSYAAYVDKISLMAATGELADLQFCNAFNDVPLMMENDLLRDTDSLLQEHGQNILAATPQEAWASTVYDGKQYAAAHNIYDLNIWVTTYRKDWLDALGLPVPQTLDEYAAALKAFTFNNPAGSGHYGRGFFNSIKFDDDLFHAFDVAVGHHANGFWRDRGGQLALDWVQPGMQEAWAWLAQLWADQVIDPNSITAQITYWGQPWVAGLLGSQYTAWTAIDSQILELSKVDPAAAIVAGPAPKGPGGHQGFTGEGFPWVYVIPKSSEHPDVAMQILDWFMAPQQAARFTCDGELGYTLKDLTAEGWCQEYTLEEKQAMGDEWTDRVNESQDISAYGGLWLPLGGTAIRPWLLDDMPPEMAAHLQQVHDSRYSEAALQAKQYSEQYTKVTAKSRPTASEKTYWPSLQSRFLEIMSQVVAGSLGVESGWNDWLDYFENNGGPTLTEEVNQIA